MDDRASGAAQRRRGQRQRAALRHEQQSIAMALAAAMHHTVPRELKKARVREVEERKTNEAKQGQSPFLHPKLFELSEEENELQG